jgi:hypothetical protein
MKRNTDLKLPKDVQVKDPDAVIQAVLNICREADIKSRLGFNKMPAVKCDVEGLTLGHWYKLWEALGPEVCSVILAVKAQRPERKEDVGNG